MSDLQLLEDGGAVVRDGDITDVVDKHLVEALRPERRLDDVGEGKNGENVLSADILALLALTENTNAGHLKFELE